MYKKLAQIPEILAYLQIVASPLLAGCIAGALIYFYEPGTTRLILALLVVAIGLTAGIIWANRKRRSPGGATGFMARVMASPDLDRKEPDSKK